MEVELRPVRTPDVEAFFLGQQSEGEPERDVFTATWACLLADPSAVKRSVYVDGKLAGNVLCFTSLESGCREVAYWVHPHFRGRGVATAALRALLSLVKRRPLNARAARENVASIHVLERCGFVSIGRTGSGETLFELS